MLVPGRSKSKHKSKIGSKIKRNIEGRGRGKAKGEGEIAAWRGMGALEAMAWARWRP